MITAEELVAKHTSRVKAGERFAAIAFPGGNNELGVFLNHMPANWRLINSSLARSVLESAGGLFEIAQAEMQ